MSGAGLGEPGGGGGGPGGGGGGGSFAEAMGTFGKLTELKGRIGRALETSRVPWSETRKFLSGRTVSEIASTPLAQFIKELFEEVGLGRLELTAVEDFSYTFRNYACPICDLFPDVKDKKVCNPTTDALHKFFNTDMDLMNASEETHCRNEGAEYCEFTVDVRRLSVYMILLDRVNIQILRESFGSSVDEEILRKRLNLSGDDISGRLERLQELNIFDADLHLTESGEAFRQYLLGNPPAKEDDFDPPWKAMSEISTSIAATQSFAEALVEIMDDDFLPWEDEGEEAKETKKDAKAASGFGALLAGAVKKDKKDEEEGEGEGGDGANGGGGE